jgi:hypothetical protein
VTLRERMVMTQKRLITPIEELRDAGQEKMAEYFIDQLSVLLLLLMLI